MKDYEIWFENYAKDKISSCPGDKSPMLLKRVHSKKVQENAAAIAVGESWPEPARRLAEIAGLFHDIARFDQYLRYGTFRDRESRSHGLMGVQILKRENVFEMESPQDRKFLYCAAAWHNRYELPHGLAQPMRDLCAITRDADKLDILRIMAAYLAGPGPHNPTVILGLPDAPEMFSSKVLEDVMAGRIPSYGDLLSVNDFRALLGSWLFGLEFAESRRIFLRDGYGAEVTDGLPANEIYGPIKRKLLSAYKTLQAEL